MPRHLHPSSLAFLSLILAIPLTPARAADAPKIKSLTPANGAQDIDPSLDEIRIVFDRDMDTTGYSLCGGGPTYPQIIGSPRWEDAHTLVAKVKLLPDHSYALGVNAPAFQNFRAADGTPLSPVEWTFTTAARLSRTDQKNLNDKSLTALMKALRQHYSYYEFRKLDWTQLEKQHRRKIVTAGSTSQWVRRVAKMLEPAKDVHLWLDYQGAITGTFQRKITPNFDLAAVKKLLPKLKEHNRCIYSVTNADDIGYLLITSFDNSLESEIAEAQTVLADMSKKSKALILDVRPNSGGNELLAKNIAAWFVDGEKTYAKNCYRDRKAKGGFGPILARKIKGNPPDKRYPKPVIVLMGAGNMSSAESFLLMMKQGRDVTLMGESSYGSSGNPKPHKLPNDVSAFIPSWKDFSLDGTTLETKGIPPDIEVKTHAGDFRTGDPVLKKALQLAKKKSR